jgi:hypothetical protein
MPDAIKRLTCPAEDASRTIDLDDMTKPDLVRWIAGAFPDVLRYNEKGDKAFLGVVKAKPVDPPAKPGPVHDPSLVGPKKTPTLKKGDFHLVVNDRDETLKAYDSEGKLVAEIPCLAKGVNGRTTWANGGDTPPGLYKLGTLYRWTKDEGTGILNAFGLLCWDLEEQEGQENVRGRDGIALHCGGTGAWPSPTAARQTLEKTLGCVRVHNEDAEKVILPLSHVFVKGAWQRRPNTVWVSVFQDCDR